ncbi:Domain of unknown function DUF3857 [Flavobacteriaceae bacterium]
MITKQLTTFLGVLLFCFNANAQEFKLGKVSIAELEQKAHPKDTAAVAAILFKKGETRFEFSQSEGFVMYTEVDTRIKIYKKEGYDWANQNIRYCLVGDSKEFISVSDAVTFNLVNGKIEKTKLKSEGEFDENINKYWGQKKITLPNVKEGSIIEFHYTIKTKTLGSFREWSFQSSIPVNHSEFTTYIPEFFVYKTNKKGFIFPNTTTKSYSKSITLTSKENRGNGSGFVGVDINQSEFAYQENQTKYLAENLPAMKEEAYVNNIENYTSSISHELSMIKINNIPTKKYSTDWESVTKKIYEFEDFGHELNKTGYFEEDLKTLISSKMTSNEIIGGILDYVKTNIKWNGSNNYYCNDGVKAAYKNKTGNVAEINLMLTSMLRYAGFDANPVIISTRANGIALFPSLNAFNYVISAIETAEGLILMDASEIFSTPNVLPLRDLNWFGRLIRKDGTSVEVDLMPKNISTDYVMMNYSIDSSGKIEGKLRRQRTDHNALIFRNNFLNKNEDVYIEKLENDNQNIEINDFSMVNVKDIPLPVIENFSFTSSNLCELIGGKIYVNPMLFFAIENSPFKQESREFPVDYGFPFMDKYTINIDIPEGYVIEILPKSAVLNMEDNIGNFKFISNASENKIQLSVSHQINTPIVSSEYYSMLKEYYQAMIAKETEKIVLKKV